MLSTLHTNSAHEAVTRIVDVFPGDEKQMVKSLLASALVAVISQSLIKTKDGKSRVAAYEILIATDAIKNLIREGSLSQIPSMMQVGSKYGMITLEDSLGSLVSRGLIDNRIIKELIHKNEETA